jgi:hypothetical protein
MARGRSVLLQRRLWTALVALAALAFWVAGTGVGWRAWILTGPRPGIVAHTEAFGLAAAPWWIVASVLSLMTVVMGIGVSLTRHLVDGKVEPVPPVEPVPELPALEPKEPRPTIPAGPQANADDPSPE